MEKDDVLLQTCYCLSLVDDSTIFLKNQRAIGPEILRLTERHKRHVGKRTVLLPLISRPNVTGSDHCLPYIITQWPNVSCLCSIKRLASVHMGSLN